MLFSVLFKMDLCPESDGLFTADFCFRLVEDEDDESTLGEKFCAIRRKRCENYKLELHLPARQKSMFLHEITKPGMVR